MPNPSSQLYNIYYESDVDSPIIIENIPEINSILMVQSLKTFKTI